MEPFLAKTALDVAVDRTTSLLERAGERREDDVARCMGYLEAALAAIQGLEAEYDAILVEAYHVGNEPNEISNLRRRIDTYLHLDRLRPRLHDAVVGLDFYSEQFQNAATKYVQWPWRRADRESAASEFSELLGSLRDYLSALDKGAQHRTSGTGVGIEALIALKRVLDAPISLHADTPRQTAEHYQYRRDKEPMFELLRRIRLTAEKIRQSFV